MSVGKTYQHDSSYSHVTGESIYIDDRSMLKNEVLVGIVGAPINCGKIKKIFLDEARKVSGIVGVFTANDFFHNRWGTIVPEQPILVEEKIGYIDEPIIALAGITEEAISIAKKLIKFEVEEEESITTIDEAILGQSILLTSTPFKRGDNAEAFKKSKYILQGDFESGGQEHFYLESQSTIVYPLENGMLEVHSSSQHPTETQHVIAHALGLDFSQVICIVKRMGGGFGGKESQAAHFAAIAALCAKKLNRPARLCLSKDDDMMMTGKRHPFKSFYEVGFDDQGKIEALKVRLYANAGAYTDLTPSILDRALFHIDNCYYLENCSIEGVAVRTNQQSHTAFRGFGGPQGALVIENILEEVATFLKIDSLDVRMINLYQKDKNNMSPYGQIIENNILPDLYERLRESSEYDRRRMEIDEFNQKNIMKVRGLSFTGCKFGIAFTAKYLNQGNALVNVHLDGTVQVSTGATEMGQGVNTKIAQIVAHTLAISVEKVKVMSTSTEKNHNTSPTAASSGTDINGGAALKATSEIVKRLKWIAHYLFLGIEIPEFQVGLLQQVDLNRYELKNETIVDTESTKSISLLEIIKMAYFNRISLGEYAHFITEGIGFDKKLIKGKAFKYFTMGAAVSEVEIDEYTGELKVLRTDLLMDLGRSLNPGIDHGQVTGAFIQSMGWLTTENLYYNEKGKLLSHSPTTYKIPNIQDTPRIFNVNFFENDLNMKENIFGSKAVGEPPFLLGISVFTAIKNAMAYRLNERVILSAPATHEKILMGLSNE